MAEPSGVKDMDGRNPAPHDQTASGQERTGEGRGMVETGAGKRGRLLIFIVAYNAERTIESVLRRIPVELAAMYEVEVLIIDDSSQDQTFVRSELANRQGVVPFRLTVLFNPVNQGYGGNQKIGFHYAIEKGFDWVALVHGDGQYAPECLPQLLEPLVRGEAEAVFGSRMLDRGAALKGGMPLYKYIGNKILTRLQNALLGSALSEFHSGYRLYATKALAAVPFALNSNDFHFDTEIIIQCIIAGQRIRELPIPTFYGDEICHVNGMKYAWDVCWTTLHSRVQRYHIFYDRKFDCALPPEESKRERPNRLETAILEQIDDGSRVAFLGEAPEEALARELLRRGCTVTVFDRKQIEDREVDGNAFDCLLVGDAMIGWYRAEGLVACLRQICLTSPEVKILLHVGNIAFVLTRLLLLFGRFAYSRRGIINLQHQRLFTLRSLKKLFHQNGFRIGRVVGMPAPFERVFSSPRVARGVTAFHALLIDLRLSLFSYQFLLAVKPLPSLPYLLRRAEEVASERKERLAPPEG